MSRTFRSSETPTSWCGPRTRQVPSRLRNCRTASISSGRGLLLRDHVVQAEHEQRVRVGEHPLVERKCEAGLVDPLEHGDHMPRRLADELLERHPGPEEQLQRSRDPLLELQRVRPLRRLVGGPCHAPNLGHRREPVVELGRISARLGRIAPGDVDAHPPPTRRVLPRHMVLVVGPRSFRPAHFFLPPDPAVTLIPSSLPKSETKTQEQFCTPPKPHDDPKILLHLIEHLGQGVLDPQGLLDFVGGDIRILPVFDKARALVVPDELDERFRVGLPVHRKPFEVLEDRVDARFSEEAIASSVYLSKSVSKIPWYMNRVSLSKSTQRR